jgi:hypothetical protein
MFGFMKNFGRITTHSLVQINIITHNYACYKIVQLTLQKNYFRAIFFMKINIITPNYAYYLIVQLKLRYEYPMTLILHKI